MASCTLLLATTSEAVAILRQQRFVAALRPSRPSGHLLTNASSLFFPKDWAFFVTLLSIFPSYLQRLQPQTWSRDLGIVALMSRTSHQHPVSTSFPFFFPSLHIHPCPVSPRNRPSSFPPLLFPFNSSFSSSPPCSPPSPSGIRFTSPYLNTPERSPSSTPSAQ